MCYHKFELGLTLPEVLRYRSEAYESCFGMHCHLKSFDSRFLFPPLCAGFWFLVLYLARPPSSLRLCALPLFHTQPFHTHISLACNFVTHNSLTHNSFTLHTRSFRTHISLSLSHTHHSSTHNPFTSLSHTSFSHHSFAHST